MNISYRLLVVAGAAATVAALGSLSACTTDAKDPGAETGGSAGTSSVAGSTSSNGGDKATAGNSSTAGTSTSSAGTGGGATAGGTVCAKPSIVTAAKPGVTDFDDYDGVADLGKWSFPLGGDTTSSVLAGTFGYGDEADGFPETFEMAEGHESKYALRIADELADGYGGGMGTWLSACLDASKLSGVSLWARGVAPKGTGRLTLSMQETMPATAAKAGDKVGTCTGDSKTCIHPFFDFALTDTWTEIKIPWADFSPGDAAGTPVTADGHNVTQLQFAVDLDWMPDADGVYAPVPAPYELAIDSVTFY